MRRWLDRWLRRPALSPHHASWSFLNNDTVLRPPPFDTAASTAAARKKYPGFIPNGFPNRTWSEFEAACAAAYGMVSRSFTEQSDWQSLDVTTPRLAHFLSDARARASAKELPDEGDLRATRLVAIWRLTLTPNPNKHKHAHQCPDPRPHLKGDRKPAHVEARQACARLFHVAGASACSDPPWRP